MVLSYWDKRVNLNIEKWGEKPDLDIEKIACDFWSERTDSYFKEFLCRQDNPEIKKLIFQVCKETNNHPEIDPIYFYSFLIKDWHERFSCFSRNELICTVNILLDYKFLTLHTKDPEALWEHSNYCERESSFKKERKKKRVHTLDVLMNWIFTLFYKDNLKREETFCTNRYINRGFTMFCICANKVLPEKHKAL